MKKATASKSKKVSKKSIFKLKARGMSKVIILAVVAVILAAGGAYVLLGQHKQGAGSAALPFMKPALNPNCKYNDPELCKFMNNWQSQTSYSFTSSSNYGGMQIESTFQISGENKSHMLTKQNGKESSNVISIGDTTYTLDYKDNKWWKQTTKPDTTNTTTDTKVEDKGKFDTKEMKDTTVYKFVSKEACGTLTCFKYEITDTASNSNDGKQFIYFDDKDYLMRKMVMESGEFKSETVYSYDKVTINVPSPVKEGTPDAYGAGAGGTSGYSEAEVKKMMNQYQQTAPQDQAPDTQPPAEDTSNSGY